MFLYVVPQIHSSNIPEILGRTYENVNKQRIPSELVLSTRRVLAPL